MGSQRGTASGQEGSGRTRHGEEEVIFLRLLIGLFGFHDRLGQTRKGEAEGNYQGNKDNFFDKHMRNLRLAWPSSISHARRQ